MFNWYFFRANEIKSFKGTLIPELSDEPILIEKVSADLIAKEERKIPLNLPLACLITLRILQGWLWRCSFYICLW